MNFKDAIDVKVKGQVNINNEGDNGVFLIALTKRISMLGQMCKLYNGNSKALVQVQTPVL